MEDQVRALSGRERRAGRILIRKARQNWRWGKTHGWADLVEEHDLNPVVRGRRALRTARWRWTTPGAERSSIPVFLVGAQRSGTNMLAHALAEASELQLYNEGNVKSFHNYRLRSWGTIDPLIERSWARFVLFKPLCDSHRALEMLDRFYPRGRVIWAYRQVDGRVRSAVAKFGDSNLRVLRAYAAGEDDDAWQVQGLSQEKTAFIKSFDFDRMSPEAAAALFWYVRNSLYFDLELDRRQDVILASYDQILADPERVVGALCAFLGLRFRRDLVRRIKPTRADPTEPLPIDGRIRERCEELQERLDATSRAQLARFASMAD